MARSYIPILVVDDVELEAKLLVRTLNDAGYGRVTHVTSFDNALTQIETAQPRIVITDLNLGQKNGVELTQRLRARDDKGYVYVIVVTGTGVEGKLQDSFNAGADDFMTKPFRREEIIARVRAGERIVALETALRMRSEELETALRRIDVNAAQRALVDATHRIESAAQDQGTIELAGLPLPQAPILRGLNDFFQLEFSPIAEVSEWTNPIVADIPLSDAGRELEVCVTVVVDDASARAFGTHMFGDDDLENCKALVLELSNVLMGGLKAKLSEAGYGFAAGLPAETTLAAARAAFDEVTERKRLTFRSPSGSVSVWLRAGTHKTVAVVAKDLVEGMVLGEDVRDAKGNLLMRSGLRLTQTAADRIAKLVPNMKLQVLRPAA